MNRKKKKMNRPSTICRSYGAGEGAKDPGTICRSYGAGAKKIAFVRIGTDDPKKLSILQAGYSFGKNKSVAS